MDSAGSGDGTGVADAAAGLVWTGALAGADGAGLPESLVLHPATDSAQSAAAANHTVSLDMLIGPFCADDAWRLITAYWIVYRDRTQERFRGAPCRALDGRSLAGRAVSVPT